MSQKYESAERMPYPHELWGHLGYVVSVVIPVTERNWTKRQRTVVGIVGSEPDDTLMGPVGDARMERVCEWSFSNKTDAEQFYNRIVAPLTAKTTLKADVRLITPDFDA